MLCGDVFKTTKLNFHNFNVCFSDEIFVPPTSPPEVDQPIDTDVAEEPKLPKNPGAPADDDSLPPMAFGGIGIAAMVIFVGGLLYGLNVIRQRRMQLPAQTKREFDSESMQPTYNSHVIRSRLAPATGKFDNIRYDYERHPSGVYDVPASTNTTPACTLVGAPAFSSSKVKVDIEADDEDEYEAFATQAAAASVIVPTQTAAVGSKTSDQTPPQAPAPH